MANDTKDAGDPPQLLDPDMFLFWKKRFEVFVQVNYPDIWIYIAFAQPITGPFGKHLSFKATNLLYRAIPDKLFGIIFKCQTAHDIWTTLDMTYGGHSKIDSLSQEFETFKKLPDESIRRMLIRYDIIISSLKKLGVAYTTERYVAKVLSALPSNWNDVVKSTIREREDFAVLSVDDLLMPLEDCEMRLLYQELQRVARAQISDLGAQDAS